MLSELRPIITMISTAVHVDHITISGHGDGSSEDGEHEFAFAKASIEVGSEDRCSIVTAPIGRVFEPQLQCFES